jgi:hypothetical protein
VPQRHPGSSPGEGTSEGRAHVYCKKVYVARLAQMVERSFCKRDVGGSIPAIGHQIGTLRRGQEMLH